jgi:Ca2+-transporting ATPase
MDQKPRSKEEGIFSGGYRLYVACLGMLIGVLTLSAYLFGLLLSGHSYGMSLAFIVLALSQLVHSYNMRSKGSVFKLGLFSNKYLNGAVLISALLMLIATLTPMRALFGVEQISAAHWLIAVALSLAPLLINEIAKLVQELLNKREEKSA